MHLSLIIFLISFLFSSDAYEIAKSISTREAPLDTKATLTMTLIDKKGNERVSKIRSYTKDSGNKQIMWFLSPPSDRGVSVYKIERKDAKDEMKMWLPAFKRVRKISSSKNSESFMNSDLTFEDLYSRELNEYSYEVVDDEASEHYILTSYPEPELKSNYSKHISWVNKISMLVTKEESYSKSGRLIKIKEFNYSKIQNFDIITRIKVVDVKSNHQTILIFNDMELNAGINDNQFHESNLKRIPRNK